MAHFILEYSDNLFNDAEHSNNSIQDLFSALHYAAEKTQLFPMKGVRSRAYACHQYRLADGNPQHSFAHLEVKLGAGRTMEDKKQAADLFFSVFSNHFSENFNRQGIALSFEMKELDPVLKFNKNNIQDYL